MRPMSTSLSLVSINVCPINIYVISSVHPMITNAFNHGPYHHVHLKAQLNALICKSMPQATICSY